MATFETTCQQTCIHMQHFHTFLHTHAAFSYAFACACCIFMFFAYMCEMLRANDVNVVAHSGAEVCMHPVLVIA